MIRETVRNHLARFERRASRLQQKPAAVAIVIMLDGEVPVVPIFQRTHTMSRHPGQMAIPGGRLHEGEDVTQCALRELDEELGVQLDPGGILGMLDDFDTRSGFTITPVVIWSGASTETLRPSPDEVQQLFVVTATELHEAVAEAAMEPPEGFSLKLPEVEVFAPTAAMLYQFSEVALDGRECRVADFFQPEWTHR